MSICILTEAINYEIAYTVCHIFDALGLKLQEKTQNPVQQLDIETTSILNYILAEKKTFQEIADFTKLSTRDLNTKLIEMQMDGLIIKLAGNSYISAKQS